MGSKLIFEEEALDNYFPKSCEPLTTMRILQSLTAGKCWKKRMKILTRNDLTCSLLNTWAKDSLLDKVLLQSKHKNATSRSSECGSDTLCMTRNSCPTKNKQKEFIPTVTDLFVVLRARFEHAPSSISYKWWKMTTGPSSHTHRAKEICRNCWVFCMFHNMELHRNDKYLRRRWW